MKNNQALRDHVFDAADQHASRLIDVLQAVPYQEGGILPSEMLLFLVACRDQGMTHVVESGRCLGYSTEVLVEAGLHVISIDTVYRQECDRLKRHARLEMRLADGNHEVPKAVADWAARRPAVLLDGPKGAPAFNILARVHANAAFVAIHDLHKNRSDAKPNPAYSMIGNYTCFLSETPEWVERFGWIDADAVRIAGHSSRSSLTNFGYWLGLFPTGKWRWQNTES